MLNHNFLPNEELTEEHFTRLKEELLRHTETECLEFLLRMLSNDDERKFMWFRLAKSCLNTSASFEQIFALGIERGDASSIRGWMHETLPRMKVRRIFIILSEKERTVPMQVEKALYWLPALLTTPKSRQMLSEFANGFRSRWEEQKRNTLTNTPGFGSREA